ncbi:tetratricopeptide repeat protein [Chryseobacterium sp. MEBOG06]|uniref:tetratricopeptide repeat protein n=1 Tax=Chryseobacterium sp. MEBOG06 TaxID=2879938 RepID=UPI001F24CB21|nr:tetratricopeptide repeat protein [Chryseobacterium sp. MEBOG06]UKB82903.1 tetratricopeptide repeat protein [Chryseobacterium sp. MEBOG06]
MVRTIFLITAIAAFSFINAQKTTFKCKEVYDAVKLIDEEKYDEAIVILKECEIKDPEDYTYPYEIALAYIKKTDYKNAILLLEKIKGYSNINDYYYALLGNAYDLSGNPEQAIKSYDEGLKKFPASGRLYLEKGVVLESQGKIKAAVETYEKGIRAEPMYPSNYYRISQLYLNSKDILYGLMYGEIFLNLERTTSRSKEMSKLLYNSYKSAVKFTNQDTTIDLCQAVLIIEKNSKPDNLPFCIVFSRHFAVATAREKEINLETLSSIRRRLLKEYFNNNYSPSNVLLSYHKTMENNDLFNAYNHYIFQMGDQEAFNEWQTNNKPEYDKFVNWYTEEANLLKITKSSLYLSDQIK